MNKPKFDKKFALLKTFLEIYFKQVSNCANPDYAVVIDSDDYCDTLKTVTDFTSYYAEKISYLYAVTLFNANASLPASSAYAEKNRINEKSGKYSLETVKILRVCR